MTISYNPLLKMGIRHGYFPDQDGSVVSIIPTQSTAVIMDRLSIRMVDRGSGVRELFYGAYPARPSPLLELTSPLKLTFRLRHTDPSFPNYTDLPLEEETPHLLFFSNLVGEANAAENSIELDTSSRIPTYAPIVNKEIKASSTIRISDELGHLLASYPVEDPPKEDDLSSEIFVLRNSVQREEDGAVLASVYIDFTKLPTAKYTISIDDQEVDTLVPFHDGLQRGDIGIATIYLGNVENYGPIVLDGDKAKPEHYVMSFAARSTLWRYTLIERSDGRYTQWRIINETGYAADFPDGTAPPDERTLPNGEIAKVITSSKPIKLEKNPQRRLQLSFTKEINGENHRTTIPLPVPDGQRISNQGINPDNPPEAPPYFSDVNVYL